MTLQQKLDKIELHFIVGIGRSGSTLLTTLLNQTESCISVPEIHHFIRFYNKYKSISTVSKQVIVDYKSYIELFFKYKNNPLVGPVNYTLIDSLKIGDKITYSQLTKLVYLGLYGEKIKKIKERKILTNFNHVPKWLVTFDGTIQEWGNSLNYKTLFVR